MNQEALPQLIKILQTAQIVGVVLPERLGVDELGAAIALTKKLQLDGKEVTLFSSAKNLPNLPFLSSQPIIHRDFSTGTEFAIRVKGERTKPKQLRYEKQQEDLVVYITPESGRFTTQDIELLPQADSFELLIILGVTSLDRLGAIYSKHVGMFSNTPKIVINNKLEQEYFGAINWVEAAASSISEQISSWLITDERAMREDLIATSLLAGIIDSTQSFRDPKTTPQTLTIASELVKHGARRQDIIQHLFKTKSFALLQLWGRALARIKTVPDQNMLYTLLTEQDFLKTNSTEVLLPEVLQELVVMASNYQLIVMAAKVASGVNIYLAGRPHIKLRRLAKQLHPSQDPILEPLNSHFHFVVLNFSDLTIEQAEILISNLKLTGI
jgi:nanoRNase/pAp phosphatase (c-di-AMP/oligoRNAs hydrolase)